MSGPVIADLSRLPAAGFRSHGLWYWAGLGFMAIEGAGFALALGSYVYLMNGARQWPLQGSPPDLLWGSLQTLLMLGSLVPALILSRSARLRDLALVRFWAVLVLALNVATLVIRGFEFPHLNARWDYDAYGSIVWALMLLHTTHLVTDVLDTVFMTLFLFTHTVDTERFSDVDDNCTYWMFVVVAWLPIYALVYWAPRLLP